MTKFDLVVVWCWKRCLVHQKRFLLLQWHHRCLNRFVVCCLMHYFLCFCHHLDFRCFVVCFLWLCDCCVLVCRHRKNHQWVERLMVLVVCFYLRFLFLVSHYLLCFLLLFWFRFSSCFGFGFGFGFLHLMKQNHQRFEFWLELVVNFYHRFLS